MPENSHDEVESADAEGLIGNGHNAENRGSEPLEHHLQHEYAAWFFKNDKNREWRANLKQITSFSTVETFWSLHNHIQSAAMLPNGCDYMLFKAGIEPTWEDEANKPGGRLLLQSNRAARSEKMDFYWVETQLLMIGEGFGDDADFVNGAIVQLRAKQDKIALWVNTTDRDIVKRIEAKWRSVLHLQDNVATSFESHQEAMKVIVPPTHGSRRHGGR